MSKIVESSTHTHRGVFIVDNPIMVYSLQSLIENTLKKVFVCGTANTFEETSDKISKMTVLPDLVIAEINFGFGCNLLLLDELKNAHFGLRVLVFSTQPEKYFAVRVLHKGYVGFISKTSTCEYVSEQIASALAGNIVLSDQVSATLPQTKGTTREQVFDFPVSKLSHRELEIFLKIGHGMTLRQIAESLQLSIKTVETHRTHIKEKLGVKQNSELMKMAMSEIKYEST